MQASGRDRRDTPPPPRGDFPRDAGRRRQTPDASRIPREAPGGLAPLIRLSTGLSVLRWLPARFSLPSPPPEAVGTVSHRLLPDSCPVGDPGAMRTPMCRSRAGRPTGHGPGPDPCPLSCPSLPRVPWTWLCPGFEDSPQFAGPARALTRMWLLLPPFLQSGRHPLQMTPPRLRERRASPTALNG